MQYSDFVEEVRIMRFAQKQYVEHHSDTWLMEKRLREQKVDRLIDEAQANSKITQPTLF